MKVTGIGVHKDDFRFSTSAGEKLGSTSLGYQVQNERQMKVVTIAYVTGVDVCIEINRYTYYYWEIKEIYIKNPKPQKNS
ncbi:hypothetical protein CUC53_09915 [Aeromonas cavernicola]|uniref:Uncharacterized protein n=2 Tax=Aeromonas cavernicola TaxID=1006623 RepID=A0A2H9U4J0_9GAMM|nr:hypothetical protein CUC53_09915 [Aeromonas cavernicola]